MEGVDYSGNHLGNRFDYMMELEGRWAPSDSKDYHALREAVNDGDVRGVEAALKPTININALHGDGSEGQTLLHEAVFKSHVDVIRFLLAHGAHVAEGQVLCNTQPYTGASHSDEKARYNPFTCCMAIVFHSPRLHKHSKHEVNLKK